MKRLNSLERWEAQDLAPSAMLAVHLEYPMLHCDHDADEEEVEIEIYEVKPAFLRGRCHTLVRVMRHVVQ